MLDGCAFEHCDSASSGTQIEIPRKGSNGIRRREQRFCSVHTIRVPVKLLRRLAPIGASKRAGLTHAACNKQSSPRANCIINVGITLRSDSHALISTFQENLHKLSVLTVLLKGFKRLHRSNGMGRKGSIDKDTYVLQTQQKIKGVAA